LQIGKVLVMQKVINSTFDDKQFNPAALAVIDAVGGDGSTGDHLRCPECGHNSLSVKNGDKVLVVVHCFRCGKEGGPAIIDKLRAVGVWPTNAALSPRKLAAQVEQVRSPEERRRYAIHIWNGIKGSGVRLAPLLEHYLNARAIEAVPVIARITLPPSLLAYDEREDGVASHDPGMVMPIRDKRGVLQGVHVVWLNANLTGKRDAEPQKQSFGLVKGNFIELCEIPYDKPLPKLIIAEGAETALAMMQLTGLPAIATAGRGGFMAELDPPDAAEYIIAPDCDDDGSRRDAGRLAQRLLGHVVRIAMPSRPTGSKSGFDWNDALMAVAADKRNATAEQGVDFLILLDSMKRAIVNAPTFESVMTDEEKREIHLNVLAEVMFNNHLDYEPLRADAARDLKMRQQILDAEVERRCKALRERKSEPPKVNIEMLAASARDIIASKDVLGMLAKHLEQVIAGEEQLTKLLYLVGTSRLFEKTMHAAIKGPSAGGKSESRKRVVHYFPPEDVIEFTALSEKALLYFKDDFQHKILSMGEARGQDEAKFQDYLLRELMSEGKLEYMVPIKHGNAIETHTVTKHGPVAFIVTTTRNTLNPENETRMLSLEINDSEEQTREVLQKVALTEGYNRAPYEADYKPWHDFQRWLAAGECRVIIPFAKTLGKMMGSTRPVRLRRDFGQLLRAIKAHALLHRAQRARDDSGAIKATIDGDYAAVRELMGDLLATASELKMREAIAQTIAVVKKLQSEHGGRVGQLESEHGGAGITVRQVGDALNLDRSAAGRRLRKAVDDGYLNNLETRPGRAARYRASDEPPAEAGMLLPTPKELRAEIDRTNARREQLQNPAQRAQGRSRH
jgi:Toprim domain